MSFFSNLWESMKDSEFYYMILFLLFSTMYLVKRTNPSFGYSIIKLGISLPGQEEYNFYTGLAGIYGILFLFVIYKYIKKCINEYKNLDPKYINYTVWDFMKEPSILSKTAKKSLSTLIGPFIQFILITLGYLVLNNVGRVAKIILIVTFFVDKFLILIIPLINIWLFTIYYLIISSAISC
jgi:hypothetical protein